MVQRNCLELHRPKLTQVRVSPPVSYVPSVVNGHSPVVSAVPTPVTSFVPPAWNMTPPGTPRMSFTPRSVATPPQLVAPSPLPPQSHLSAPSPVSMQSNVPDELEFVMLGGVEVPYFLESQLRVLHPLKLRSHTMALQRTLGLNWAPFLEEEFIPWILQIQRIHLDRFRMPTQGSPAYTAPPAPATMQAVPVQPVVQTQAPAILANAAVVRSPRQIMPNGTNVMGSVAAVLPSGVTSAPTATAGGVPVGFSVRVPPPAAQLDLTGQRSPRQYGQSFKPKQEDTSKSVPLEVLTGPSRSASPAPVPYQKDELENAERAVADIMKRLEATSDMTGDGPPGTYRSFASVNRDNMPDALKQVATGSGNSMASLDKNSGDPTKAVLPQASYVQTPMTALTVPSSAATSLVRSTAPAASDTRIPGRLTPPSSWTPGPAPTVSGQNSVWSATGASLDTSAPISQTTIWNGGGAFLDGKTEASAPVGSLLAFPNGTSQSDTRSVQRGYVEQVVWYSVPLPFYSDEQLEAMNPKQLREHATMLFTTIGADRIGTVLPAVDTDLLTWVRWVQLVHLEPWRFQGDAGR